MIYHRDVGFPRFYREPSNKAKLVFSTHAKRQADLRNVVMTDRIDFCNVVVIEVGYSFPGKVNHYLVRTVYNSTHDITLALTPIKSGYLVKTLWLNDSSDTHSTLDVSKYARP